MPKKSDFLLNKALSMSPDERAKIAHCLITSLDDPEEANVDEAWIRLAEKRWSELKTGKVKAVSWDEIEQKIKNS